MMAQAEIYELMMEDREMWWTTKSLSSKLGITINCARLNIFRMKKYLEIKRAPSEKKPIHYHYIFRLKSDVQ